MKTPAFRPLLLSATWALGAFLALGVQAGPLPSPTSFATPGELTAFLKKEVQKEAAARRTDEPKPVADAPKHADIEKSFNEAARNNPMRNRPAEKGQDPAKGQIPVDLVASSDILCHRGKATLVPKKAIIQAPANFSGRMQMEKGAKILNWADFFKANRDWIKTVEITRAQAEGVEPLPEKTAETLKKATTVVVATYLGGPISMLPPKVAPETEEPNSPVP
jgi:hypothetical protein